MAWIPKSEPPEIGAPLDPVRAAILIVADGHASRVTVHLPEAERVLPAALRLARSAGVTVELVRPGGDEADLSIEPLAASGR